MYDLGLFEGDNNENARLFVQNLRDSIDESRVPLFAELLHDIETYRHPLRYNTGWSEEQFDNSLMLFLYDIFPSKYHPLRFWNNPDNNDLTNTLKALIRDAGTERGLAEHVLSVGV